MTLANILARTTKTLKSNLPEILTALGVSGVVTTSYLTAKASFKASEMIRENETVKGANNDRKERIKERTKLVWTLYIPAGVSGTLTIGCIIVSSKANGRRTAAAVTAYSLTERAFSEYREKVVEHIGNNKEQKIRDEVAQDRVSKNLHGSKEVIVVGTGHVMCCELFTQRYFRSDMEKLRKAQNDVNARVVNDMYVTLDEFYDIVGLSHTSNSNNLGWDSTKLMELLFSTVLAEGGEPCLAFEYNYTKPLR